MTDRDAFREAYNEAMGEMRGKDEEIIALRGQVRGLKEWVSSSGRGGIGGEQVTDEVVAEKMQWIGNALQNWVISNFRRGRISRFGALSCFALSPNEGGPHGRMLNG